MKFRSFIRYLSSPLACTAVLIAQSMAISSVGATETKTNALCPKVQLSQCDVESGTKLALDCKSSKCSGVETLTLQMDTELPIDESSLDAIVQSINKSKIEKNGQTIQITIGDEASSDPFLTKLNRGTSLNRELKFVSFTQPFSSSESETTQTTSVSNKNSEKCDKSACDKPACDKPACDKSACDKSACDKPACDKPACDKPACDKPACDKSACAKPACDKPACDKPACDKPACDKPACDKPACDKSACDKPACDKPACDKPACDKPACDKPACDKPACDKPACDKPACDKPACDKPACDKPACDKPACDKPACDKPACDKPACDKPACDKPACEKSACDKPACDKPACDKPACDKPACDKPACDKPACDKPACDKPACDKPACDKPACDKPACDKPACDKPACTKPACEKPACEKPACEKPACDKSAQAISSTTARVAHTAPIGASSPEVHSQSLYIAEFLAESNESNTQQTSSDNVSRLLRQAGFENMEVPVAANEYVQLLLQNADYKARLEMTEQLMSERVAALKQIQSLVERNSQLVAQAAVAEVRQQLAESIATSMLAKVQAGSKDGVEVANQQLEMARNQLSALRPKHPVPFAKTGLGLQAKPYVPTAHLYHLNNDIVELQESAESTASE